MAKITEKKVKEPVRDANEKDVKKEKMENVKAGNVKEVHCMAKERALEDVKKLIGFKQWAWMWEKLDLGEIEAILNKYL